jgi:hypothetical protein
MARNPEWFDQQRAKGICYICKRKMDDNDPKKAHSECYSLVNKGYTHKQVREKLNERT